MSERSISYSKTVPLDAALTSNLKDAYADRLGIALPKRATLEALSNLQHRHMTIVPFENVDVFFGREIDLSRTALISKILHRARGGYCFELNVLYAELLRSLGYRVSQHLGRVWLRNPKHTPPRNHLAHIVELDGKRILTDVGFGARAPRIPLDIENEAEVNDGDGLVRIISLEHSEKMVQRWQQGVWHNQYSIELLPAADADVEAANFYMSTHPKSHFRHGLFVGLFRETGRIGLWNHRMTERTGEALNEIRIESAEDWLCVTHELFGLSLSLSDLETEVLTRILMETQ